MNGLLQLIKGAAFFALLIVAIALTTHVLMRKESYTRYGAFLSSPQADVLFLGNSHGVSAIYPMELWRDYGITAYNLCGYGDTLTVSYWTLEMALERMTPRLVVVDVDDIALPNKTPKSSEDLHTNLDAFPLSSAKLRALWDLMHDPEETDDVGRRYRDIAWEYVFTLGKYHGRWSELTPSDFMPQTPGLGRGAEYGIGVSPPAAYDIIDERQRAEGIGWGYDSLRRIAKVCRARGIELLLIHLPFPAEESRQEEANAVWPIAEEYGVDFIDFVALDNVSDYNTDMRDENGHLNASGARKVTDYLGRFIREHFAVPDRRTDPAYAAWQADSEAYVAYKLDLLRAQRDPALVLSLLHDADLSTVVMIGQGSAVYEDETLMTLLQNVAREHIYEQDAYAKWSNALFPLTRLRTAAAHGAAYFVLIDRGGPERQGSSRDSVWNAPKVEERLGTGTDTLAAAFGEMTYTSGKAGASLVLDGQTLFGENEKAVLRVAVFDARTGERVACFAFDRL